MILYCPIQLDSNEAKCNDDYKKSSWCGFTDFIPTAPLIIYPLPVSFIFTYFCDMFHSTISYITMTVWMSKSWVLSLKNISFLKFRGRGIEVCNIYNTTYSAAAAAAKSLQSCPTLCDPIDGSPPGFPIPGILQARTLEGVAISFSNTTYSSSA